VLHVHVGGLVEASERARTTRDSDVDGREKNMQVLRVRDEDEEAVITAMLASRNTTSRTEFTPEPKGCSQIATTWLAKAHFDSP